ncbi:unnamed protein product [Durusdinium trenchii]|uniref:Uncharacterized protein n=1 Tax=Durusdinium trenchii TaxID=1381693 RepID=A0ABP0N3B7_9DINO
MCAGLFPNVAQVQRQSNARGTYHIFVSRQRERCAPHPSSLNFRQGNEFAANHGWLLFHDKVKTSQVYLHDTTLIGSLPILLFGGDLKILAKERKCVTVDGMIFEAKDEKAAVLFKELRRELDRLLLLKVANPAEDLSTSAEPLLLTVCGYDQLLCDAAGDHTEPWCALKEMGCPVHCADVDSQIRMSELGCPVNCTKSMPLAQRAVQRVEVNEGSLPRALWPQGGFMQQEDGCPVKCHDDEFACHLPPQHEACVQWAYCHHIKAPDLAKGWFPVYDIERL